MKLRSLTLTVFSLLGTLAIAASHNARPYDAKVFDWESITPSSDLEYHDCDGKFQCARLILPMDWLNQKNSDNITIAIRKFPAAVGDDDPTFGGTVFAQPGGPAASGTRYNLGIGPVLQNVLDRPGKKHYEILSFDIRGVGYSTPKVDCFPGLLSYLRGLESLVNGVADLSPSALAFSLAEVKADWQQCYKMCGDFLSYTSSANIARDMVGILDKIEELRRRNAHGREPIGDTTHGNSRLELRSDTSYEEGSKLRLQYIGISYGTVFGNTFASMFPGRVGRLVLDGVMDVNDVVYGRVNQLMLHFKT
jgi:pimeloyl-ACP methyl ester carboxylesterase